MSNTASKNCEGRPLRLPSPLCPLVVCARSLTIAFVVCLGIGSALPTAGQGQLPRLKHPIQSKHLPLSVSPPRLGRPARENRRPPLDKAAIELLRKMIRPTIEYSGEMVTQVAAQNNAPLQQSIKGDKLGRTLVTFLNGRLAGDILLVTPGEVRNYHRNTGVMDVAFWPTEWDNHEKRMFAAIRSGFYSARVTGEEQVAGRTAEIVDLAPVEGAGETGRPHFKFWIDAENGIQLKNEKSDAMGRVLSHRYLTSITVGPSTVLPQDFNLSRLKQAQVRPLFPPNSQYKSLEQAQGHLPFAPIIPTALPTGFHLAGVWVFPGGNNQPQFVLLRFTDEVTSFGLYERVLPAKSKPPTSPNFNRHIDRWREVTPNGDIEATYTGMLTPEQVRTLYYSLH